MTPGAQTCHGGLIALRLDGLWTGALIQGASGSGKSDLALRALLQGFRLVADDRVVLFVSAGRVFGRAPPPLLGLIEQRGLGIVAECPIPLARVALIVRCQEPGAEIERLPGPAFERLLGIAVPRLDLHPLEVSAPTKLRRALEQTRNSGQPGPGKTDVWREDGAREYLGADARTAYQAVRAPPGPDWES